MEETVWSRSSRLWTLFEWSFIGIGLIFTLIGLSVNGFLSSISPLAQQQHRKPIKDKRILIANGKQSSKLGRAIVHRLRNDHNCNVISLSRGGGGGGQEEDIICDLTNNRECRRQIQEIWQDGIDLVINCEENEPEVEEEESGKIRMNGNLIQNVGQRVEEIGSNIQQMINLLINVVPKMIARGGSGKFVSVRNGRPPRDLRENGFRVASDYEELLGQLLLSGAAASASNDDHQREPPNIDLIQLYCPGANGRHGEEETQWQSADEMARRVISAIESGKRGSWDLSQSDFWRILIAKLTLRRRDPGVADGNEVEKI